MELEPKRIEARWKGTIDLDQEAVSALSLDGMVFFVVGVRVEQMGATRVNRDGDHVRKDIFDVTDARVLLDHNREQAVEFLAGRSEIVDTSEFTSEFEGDTSPALDVNDRSSSEELSEVSELPEFPDIDESESEGIIGSIHDYKKPATEKVASGNVGKFRTGAASEPETVEVVGQVRQYKDKALARFMEGGS